MRQTVQRQCDIADMTHLRQLMPAGAIGRRHRQVGTGAELATGTREHHHAVVGAFDAISRNVSQQLVPHLVRGRVLLRRPVEHDRDDTRRDG